MPESNLIPRCTICRFAVTAADDSVECVSCGQTYHARCWTTISTDETTVVIPQLP